MTAPLRHPLRPDADPLDRGPDGRIIWHRPPETGPQRARRIARDALAVMIGLALTAVMLAGLFL